MTVAHQFDCLPYAREDSRYADCILAAVAGLLTAQTDRNRTTDHRCAV